jgi:cobaltochelatase CobS
MTADQAEQILGKRGDLRINSENRPTIRKWLSANGFPALFVAGLSLIEMQNAYNQTDGKGLDAIRRKLDKAQAADEGELGLLDADETPAVPVQTPAVPEAPQAPSPAVNAPAAAPANPGDALQVLRDLLLSGQKIDAGLSETQVRQIVADAVAGIAPHVIEVKHPDGAKIKIDGITHQEFERCVKYITGGLNLYLTGPAGSGKSHMATQLAKALNLDPSIIACSGGVSETDLYGRILPRDNWAYVPSDMVRLYERGNCLIVLDEFSGLDPNVGMSLNLAMANGHMYLPLKEGEPFVKRGPNVNFIITDNTFGTGANPMFAGRNMVDGATLDRTVFVEIDYDRRLEESIGTAGGLSAAEMAALWELRDKVRENVLRRTISTRAFQKAAVMKACGDTWREIMARLVIGWTKDEKAKVGM